MNSVNLRPEPSERVREESAASSSPTVLGFTAINHSQSLRPAKPGPRLDPGKKKRRRNPAGTNAKKSARASAQKKPAKCSLNSEQELHGISEKDTRTGHVVNSAINRDRALDPNASYQPAYGFQCDSELFSESGSEMTQNLNEISMSTTATSPALQKPESSGSTSLEWLNESFALPRVSEIEDNRHTYNADPDGKRSNDNDFTGCLDSVPTGGVTEIVECDLLNLPRPVDVALDCADDDDLSMGDAEIQDDFSAGPNDGYRQSGMDTPAQVSLLRVSDIVCDHDNDAPMLVSSSQTFVESISNADSGDSDDFFMDDDGIKEMILITDSAEVGISTRLFPCIVTSPRFCSPSSSNFRSLAGKDPSEQQPSGPENSGLHLVRFTASGLSMPFIRPLFPRPVSDRSPILGVSSHTVLRTCFRIGEALNVGSTALRSNTDVVIELYARVVHSERPAGSVKQQFQLADVFSGAKPPFLKGTYALWKGVDLWDNDSKVFLGETGQGKMARLVGRLKQDPDKTSLEMLILSVWEADWEDVGIAKGIVCF
ncbi:MAG: hypothetical protein Q9190_007125 [Brigantiaea leucoxantha]